MKKIVIISLVLIVFSSYKPLTVISEKSYLSALTSDSLKYWDPYFTFDSNMLGVGWLLNQDMVFIEYSYVDNGERRKLNYGDIIWDTFSFTLDDDLIYINNYNDYKFKIIKVSDDSLILKDLSEIRYTYLDTFLLVKSDDQVSRIH